MPLDRALIDRLNPWWSDPAWAIHDIHLVDATAAPFRWDPRPFDASDLTSGALFTLRGARRTGKTTVLKRIALARDAAGAARRTCYLSLQPATDAADLRAAIELVLRLFPGEQRDRLFLLDELTFVPGWARQLMFLREHDARFRRATVILSGSSASDLAGSAATLAGRRGRSGRSLDRLHLPMSFRDFAAARDPGLLPAEALDLPALVGPGSEAVIAEAALRSERLDEVLGEYVAAGGLPRAVRDHLELGAVSNATLEEVWQVMRSDVASLDRDPSVAAKLLSRVAASLGAPASWRSMAEEMAVHHRTVEEYVSLLAAAFVLWVLHQEDPKRPEEPSLKKVRKLYFADPLFARLAGHVGSAIVGTEALVENAIGSALFRHVEREPLERFAVPRKLFLFRSARGNEVDFVVHLGRPYAIESRYATQIRSETRRSLTAGFGAGLIVTRRSLALDGPVREIPAGVFLALLSPEPLRAGVPSRRRVAGEGE